MSAKQFVHWAGEHGFNVQACDDLRSAVEDADLICTVTASRQALVDAAWVAPGAHVNAVGAFEADARELHGNLVARATIVVDSREEATKAAGDLLLAQQEGLLAEATDFAELAEVLAGRRPGRTDGEEITVFKSLGLAIEDIAVAAYIVRAAQDQGLGIEVSL